MRDGWNVKDLTGTKLDDRAVVERGGGRPGQHEPDVFDCAAGRTDSWTDVLGPFPSRLVGRAADRQAADVDELELALDEHAGFVGCVELFESDRIHDTSAHFVAQRSLLRIELVAAGGHEKPPAAAEEQAGRADDASRLNCTVRILSPWAS